MTASEHRFELLSVIKTAEPIAVLASLSLVITVFTFDHQDKFQAVYNYSVISSFMFIFSFIGVIVSKIDHVKSQFVFNMMAKWAVYFFLAIGILYLLGIAYEFGRQHTQIFNFVWGWMWTFWAAISFLAAKRIYDIEFRFTTGSKFKSIAAITFLVIFGMSTTILSGNYLLDALAGIKTGFASTNFLLLSGFAMAGLGFTQFFDDIWKIKKKGQRPPQERF